MTIISQPHYLVLYQQFHLRFLLYLSSHPPILSSPNSSEYWKFRYANNRMFLPQKSYCKIQDKKMINLIMKNVELRLPYAGVFTRHDDSIESSIIGLVKKICLIHCQLHCCLKLIDKNFYFYALTHCRRSE